MTMNYGRIKGYVALYVAIFPFCHIRDYVLPLYLLQLARDPKQPTNVIRQRD